MGIQNSEVRSLVSDSYIFYEIRFTRYELGFTLCDFNFSLSYYPLYAPRYPLSYYILYTKYYILFLNEIRDTHLLSRFHFLPAPKRYTLYAPRSTLSYYILYTKYYILFLNSILDTIYSILFLILKDIIRCDIIRTKKIYELPCCVRAD